MIIRLKISLFVVLLSFLTITSTALADTDWQYWNALNFKKSINKKVDFKVSLYERFNRSMHHLFYAGFQIGPVFKIKQWLDISPSYCYIQSKDSKGHFRQEDRPTLDVILKWKMNMLKFTNRARVEYRFLKTYSHWRYREYLMMGLPFSIRKHSVMPYVSAEIFYEERRNEFDQRRFSSGVLINIIKGIDFDIYYLFRTDKDSNTSDEWTDANVLGTAFTFSF